MSDHKRFKSRSSKKRGVDHQGYPTSIQNVPDGSENVIQDQIIIAPEVMKKILENLELRSLKQVRLVCKSWLLEAQAHMERRGIVILHESSGSSLGRVQRFLKMREQKIPVLPQPFGSMDVCIGQHGSIILKWLVTQIRNLDRPLMITRFTQGEIPLSFAIPLIAQHSSTLEYLMLSLKCTDEADAIPLNPEKHFPRLRHLNVDTGEMNFVTSQVNALVALISGIVKASPKLEVYEFPSASRNSAQLTSSLLVALDIRNAKTLKLSPSGLRSTALLHFMSIPFCQLQNLKLIFSGFSGPVPSPLSDLVLTTTLSRSATTLKKLNLSRDLGPGNLLAECPICPCVQELTLRAFPYLNNGTNNIFLSDRFPSLQVLNVTTLILDVLGDWWTSLPPLSGLKTLRTTGGVQLRGGDDPDELPIRFLSKFPSLERVRLNYSFVMHCCRMTATGDPQVANLLGSVKHLELNGLGLGFRADDYSPLAALTGIETLTLVSSSEILGFIPFQDMHSLRAIRFPWSPFLIGKEIRKLLAISERLEKILITNCCSIPRTGDPRASKALQSFFESAPNTECGCKDWKETSVEWD